MLKTFELLCRYIQEWGYAPTHLELAELTGFSMVTIWRHVAALQDAGYVKVNGVRNMTLLYEIVKV